MAKGPIVFTFTPQTFFMVALLRRGIDLREAQRRARAEYPKRGHRSACAHPDDECTCKLVRTAIGRA